MTEPVALGDIAQQFQLAGAVVSVAPHGSGHINHSYRVCVQQMGKPRCYLLQRLNTDVFHAPAFLMENVQRVTGHLAEKLADHEDVARRVLHLVPTRDGRTWHQHSDGSCWRMFDFIEGVRSYDTVGTPAQAFQAAQAFGNFQRLLSDLPAPRLHETIAAFHDTPKRFFALEQAIAADVRNRAAAAAAEIDFLLQRKAMCSVLLDANPPERVTHNDTKLNNVLFDDRTGEALCVVDLDTVMPGLALYDFGDMVRTATSPADEDEQDLSKVTMRMPFFEALVKGYVESAGGFLTDAEIHCLPVAGRLIALEQAIRFLWDHLSGDGYYKASRPDHNLHRCRTQLQLVRSMEQQEEAMQSAVLSMQAQR